MRETIEVINLNDGKSVRKTEKEPDVRTDAEEPNYILRVQLFVCLFAAAVLYFAWKQGGSLWQELSRTLQHIIEDGISFSGQEELTRFTDEVRGLFGNVVRAFVPVP